MSHRVLASFFIFSLIFSCTPKLDIPEPGPGTANFQKTIAIGGNYLAGYQDGALYLDGQKYSIPALLAKQFELAGGGVFRQPLMPDNTGLGLNSKPWESAFVTKSILGYKFDCNGEEGLKPIKNTFDISQISSYYLGSHFQNMSVPFAQIQDLFDPLLGNSYPAGNLYYNRFAGNPGFSTVISDAISQNPTFLILWLGMEDIYEYAGKGGSGEIIPSSSQFSSFLDSVLNPLIADGTKGVIANIPDLESYQFYTLIPWNGLELTQSKADSLNQLTGGLFNFIDGENGFVIEDVNTTNGYRQMGEGEYILLNVPIDSMKCNFMGVFDVIPNRYVLDSLEVQNIKQAITNYNQIIMQKASQYDIALVNVNSYFKDLQAGIKWDGIDFNAEFVSGGFFSLDGYHPNQKGYALIANEFIKAINQKYDAVVPTVNCSECIGIRFP